MLENFIDLNLELTRSHIRILDVMTIVASSANNWELPGTGRKSNQKISNPNFGGELQTPVWNTALAASL